MRSLMPGPAGSTIIFIAILLLGAGASLQFPEAKWVWPLLAVVMLIVFFAPLGIKSRNKSRGETYVELDRRFLRVPRSPSSDRHDEVPLENIESLLVRGEEPNGLVLIGTARKTYVLPMVAFAERNAARTFHELLRARIAAGRDGRVQLAEIDRRNEDALLAMKSRVGVTQVLIAVLAIVFFLQRAGGAFDGLELLHFGANARVLVQDGQWFRLFSAPFLHGHEGHLVMNAIALFSLGFMVERLIGPARFALIYFFAALTGSVATLLGPWITVSVGASGAIYGLFAAFAYLQIRFRTRMPAGFHSPLRTWGWLLAVNVMISFAPQIDWLAHFGGFAGGLLMTYLLTSAEDRFPLPRAPAGQLVALGALCAIFIAGGVKAAENNRAKDATDVELYLDSMAETPYGADWLNAFAWEIAVDPKASEKSLRLALDAAQRSYELEKRVAFKPQVLDTIAQVHHRLGEHDRAIELELSALQDPHINDLKKDQDRFIATQLARFIVARGAPAESPLVLTATTSRDSAPGNFYVVRAQSNAEILGLIVAFRTDPEPPAIPESWPREVDIVRGVSAPLSIAPRVYERDPESLRLP